jgi:diaminopimelate decarboxylase
MLENYHGIRTALDDNAANICYALKANSNLSLLSLLAAEGAGADVVSSGEIYLALKAGFPASKIAFAGVGKREDEILYALENDVTKFNVESVPELQLLSLVALRLGKTAEVSLRVNPDIDAESNPTNSASRLPPRSMSIGSPPHFPGWR